MNTCSGCSHWDATEYGGKARRSNQEPGEGGPWGYCRLIADAEHGEPRSERAFTLDASDYQSWLMTRHDFGCVEWEAK